VFAILKYLIIKEKIKMASPSKNGFSWFARKFLAQVFASNFTAGANVTEKATVGGTIHRTYEFTAKSIATTDTGATGAQASLKIVDLPQGNITFLGATADLTISRATTNIAANAAVVASLGTVAAGADATLTSTEANLIPSMTATLSSGNGTAKGESTTVTMFDGTTTPIPIYLNFAMPDAASSANDALIVSGKIIVAYVNSGDN
jgi:hypothetical protein